MQRFQNILYVSEGIGEDVEGLKQALSLARNAGARLTFLLFHPPMPEVQHAYARGYHSFLEEQIQAVIRVAREAAHVSEADVQVSIEVESLEIPAAIRVIQRVLRFAHDLVIKEASVTARGKGFKSTDMTLLRKCPCPVWLARPISVSRREIRVAVAVDPESRDQADRDLSIRLLQLAMGLAATCSGELDIVSCWRYEFEEYLRSSIRVQVPASVINSDVEKARERHLSLLEELVRESGIAGSYRIRHLKGDADVCVPAFIEEQRVHILVMGTIARTGLRGFLIGNTAENIVDQLGCALLAVKPHGFVSPVRPY